MKEKRTVLTILLSACLIFTFAVSFGSFFSKAESSHLITEARSKYFTSIEIEQGDTLWEIALHYMSDEYPSAEAYIDEVMSLNSLHDDRICAGQFLMVPYYADALSEY